MRHPNVFINWFWAIFWPLFYLIIWGIFLRAENPSLMTDDSGETIASSVMLGIPHPPGYPLYNLIGHLASFVPMGTIAFRLNCISALFTLLALFLILKTCRNFFEDQLKENSDWEIDRNIFEFFLFSLSVSFCFCQTVFAQSLTAKGGVYTLTLSLLSYMVMIFLSRGNILKKYFLIFYFLGLGLSNHWETSVLWIPFLFFALKSSGFRMNLKAVIYLWNFLLIGISAYLYLPIRAKLKPSLNFLDPVNWNSFWQLVSRHYYSASNGIGETHHYWNQL